MDKTESILGLRGGRESVLDIISARDYPTTEGYLHALTMLEMQRKTPEYQAARRSVLSEIGRREEEKARAEQQAKFEELRRNVQLDAIEKKNIHNDAAKAAAADYAAGKISAGDIDKRTAEIEKKLTASAKDKKATSASFNAILRGQL